MAEVIWTEPALTDLDAIADYIALENPEAANKECPESFRPHRAASRAPKEWLKTTGA